MRRRLRGLVPRPTARESRELVIRLFLLPLAILPRRSALPVCRLLARVLVRPGSGYAAFLVERVPPEAAVARGVTPVEFAREAEALMRFEAIVLWRDILVPWRKRPVSLRGMEHVHSALEEGHGAILWVMPCLSSNVAVKQALHDAGHALAHLSRPGHPFSSGAFGQRFVNPVLRRPEVRVLAERVVIDDRHTVTALRRLRALLAENRVVSITVTRSASRVDAYPFLGGTGLLPAGPVQLAASTGAALLPVFTCGSPNRPTVLIGPRLQVSSTSGDTVDECHREALSWLEARIREDPLAWTGWRNGLFRPGV